MSYGLIAALLFAALASAAWARSNRPQPIGMVLYALWGFGCLVGLWWRTS